jgi:hypothetical protein
LVTAEKSREKDIRDTQHVYGDKKYMTNVGKIKMLFIVPTDAHYYKIVEKLKHLRL